MKINFNTELKTISGKEIKGEDNKILTLGDVCTNALLTNFKDENIEGKKRLDRFISTKRLNMLLMGSIRQLNDKITQLEARK